MFRTLLAAAALALLCSHATAQSKLLRVPDGITLRSAGTYHVATGLLTPPSGQPETQPAVVYNNTCPTNFYFPLTDAGYLIDEGRIPSTGSTPAGARDAYRISSLEIAYLTDQVDSSLGGIGATVRVRIFQDYDDCVDLATAGTPLADVTIPGLPAGAFPGDQTGYTVTVDLTGFEFCLSADADGAYDGVATSDKFGYVFSMPDQYNTSSSGIFTGGDPAVCAYGQGTHYLDPGSATGTGLDNSNLAYWDDPLYLGAQSGCYVHHPGEPFIGAYFKLSADFDDDFDGDGVPDCSDGCASDPDKSAPGACGCGVSDVDSDGDGAPDCTDGCPSDPAKTAPGVCGCGVSDVDSDGDGTEDCDDGCPDDPDKLDPGLCGCGVPDYDSDFDGVADCVDGCPFDYYKTDPGVCGCGVYDYDSDGDGTFDCNDGCPYDPAKTAPGVCGCGYDDSQATLWLADVDGDGFGDDANLVLACVLGPGVALVGGDCDDSDPNVHPGAAELCDGVDQDCDGTADDSAGPATIRASYGANGERPNQGATSGRISADGRFVAFTSYSDNLVAGDGNQTSDVFVVDRQTGAVVAADIAPGGELGDIGAEGGDLSADGQLVAFLSSSTNLHPDDTDYNGDVFVRDLQAGVTELVSVSTAGVKNDGYCAIPHLSADGRYVVFTSSGATLDPLDGNGFGDIYLRDRPGSTTERISVDTGGGDSDGDSNFAVITPDGRFVAFYSFATDLVAGDTNGRADVFLRDRQAGTTERISVATDGSQGNFDSYTPFLSSDGRFVTFYGLSTTLVAGDTNFNDDVFLRDRQAGTTERISLGNTGVQGNNFSSFGMVSDDGRLVVFYSGANNLVAQDDNGYGTSIFVRDRQASTTVLVSYGPSGVQRHQDSYLTAASPDAHHVSWWGVDEDVPPGGSTFDLEVFVRDLVGGAQTFYADVDGDGFGDAGAATSACVAPPGYVADATDCDDSEASVHPGAPEVCDGLDNDCNLQIDEGVTSTFYADGDGDGFGDPNDFVVDCTAPPGYVANADDECPADAGKHEPGVCGCGVPDTDTDGDATPDCIDGCPDDAGKIAPGSCGCGVADTDSDDDGTPDCHDGCPLDAFKIAPGACGCGVADVDGDGDGTPDCHDGCPTDPDKLAPGACGCGVADVDGDGDGTPDCHDGCPSDPAKVAPGACGCGVADTDSDGDGTADCIDGCPNDPLKIAPGVCDCGQPDVDTDLDGVYDCDDNCDSLSNPGQEDCNLNGIGDRCDLAAGTSLDFDGDDVPDECQGTGTAFCFGDGSDGACPCGNTAGAGQGCRNSTGQGAQLYNAGGTSVAGDNAIMVSIHMPLSKSGIVFMGTGSSNLPFGAGRLCIFGGAIKRFPVQSSGVFGYFVQTTIVSLSHGLIVPGGTWNFQSWYRDPNGPCSNFNLSNAVQTTFTP